MSIGLPLLIVIIICVIIAVMALRRPILFRMGLRNLTRRRAQTLIVILGLLIGTAIISSSLVVGDTLEYIFVDDVIDRLDAVDELVYDKVPRTEEYLSFDYQVYVELKDSLAANNTPIDGIAPLLVKRVGVQNIEEDMVEGGVTLTGFNASLEEGFGTFGSVEKDEIIDEDLTGYDAIINARLSEKLNAARDQNITVFIDNLSYNLSVKYIAKDEGKGNWQKEPNIFISLTAAQTIFNETGKINVIKISNKGGVVKGVELSTEVSGDVRSIISDKGWTLEVDENKKNGIENAKEFSDYVTEIFMVLGMFSIIAGVILIMNIFVMLAEERKSEMGISRAVGMKRSHLMQTYLFEGLLYAIFAAILGTFFGLIVGYVLIWSFGAIFAGLAEAEGISLTFHYEPISIVLSFCIGLIITFFTIAVTSWKVSKLNIVRAIKKIPEPVSEKATSKTMLLGVLLIIIGAFLTLKAIEVGTSLNTWIFAGPGLMILGIAFLLYRVVKARIAFTIAGISIIAWILLPRGAAKGEPADIQMFIVIGLLLVLGGILIVMFNSDYILKPLLSFRSKKKGRPVLRIATSYPMRKKFRTGMTLAIFALVIFTVTVISMMSHLQSGSVAEEIERQTGGFDIIGRTMRPQPINLTKEIEESETLSQEDFEFYANASIVGVSVKTERQEDYFDYVLWGFNDDMLEFNEYTFKQKADNYTDADGAVHTIKTDRDVWDALKKNSSLAVVDGSAEMLRLDPTAAHLFVDVGDAIEVVDGFGNRVNLTVIGIMDQLMYYTWGIFANNELVKNFPNGSYAYFFKLESGADGPKISQDIEKTFFAWNMDAVYIPDEVKMILDIQRSVMLLLQAYLGLGLLVGIAGLGVITVRSVVERKQEIGTLRAIGFKSRMISKAFLLEISFIAILGIVIGVLLGLALSYDMYLTYYSSRVAFSIPWLHLLLICTIAFIATLIATSSPARRASKIPPAEAIRYTE